MKEATITKEAEEKRLKDFKEIAENWDSLPEYVRGKLDGTISAFAAFYRSSTEEKKTG